MTTPPFAHLTIGILPWHDSSTNPYQKLMAKGFESSNVKVEKLAYASLAPLHHATKVNKADIILLDWAHSFYTSPGLPATLVKTALGIVDRARVARRNIPIIWNMHNLHRHDNRHTQLERWSFRQLARTVDGIRVFNKSSEVLVREYLHVPDSTPIHYIPHGNYINILRRDPSSNFSILFSLQPDDFVLLLPGTIREGKGIPEFIQSFGVAARQFSNIKLIVAGKPQNDALADKIKSSAAANPDIHLHLDFIPDYQMQNLFDVAHFVVLPYENMLNSGMALLAFSAGKPVIGSEAFKGYFPENLLITGSLSDPIVLANLVNHARKLNYHQLGTNALAFAQTLSWDRIAAQIRDWGIELITKRKEKR